MKRLMSILAGLVVVTMLAPGAAGAPAAREPDDIGGSARVKVHPDLSADLRAGAAMVDVIVTTTRPARAAELFGAAGPFAVGHEFRLINGFSARLNEAQVRALGRNPLVVAIEPDLEVIALNAESNDEFGTAQARADLGLTGAGVTICVLDTGIDADHEAFPPGKIVDHYDPVTGSPTPIDDHGHGTHVAATAAGDGPAGSDGVGVAPGAALLSAKVLDSAGSGPESQIIAGMDWCVARGAQVLSMSLGTSSASDGTTAMDAAANNAVAQGVVVVAAAGNSGDGPGTVGSPGAATDVLTVGAATKMSDGLRLAGFSSRGPLSTGALKPDIVAPGVSVSSADANTGTGYVAFSGTSMATPFVSGTVALALEADPGRSPDAIKAEMTSTAIDLGPAGADGDWGAGLLDAYAFLSGGTGALGLPTHQQLSGSVTAGSSWSGTFEVAEDALGLPAAAAVLIADTACTSSFFGLCFGWGPDLDARLVDPNGTTVAVSECPLSGECYGAGHQETFTFVPTVSGTWELQVYPWQSEPGSAFSVDVFTGAPGSAPPPPPPPEPNETPIAIDDDYAVDEDVVLTVAAPGVLGNDTDTDGDPLTVIAWNEPAHGSVSGAADGSFAYTPAADFDGTDSFDYEISDGRGGSATATVTVTIAPVNDAPIAVDDAASTMVDTTVVIDVVANDSDPEGSLVPSSAVPIAVPAPHTAVGNGDGTISFTPAPAFVGVVDFSYQVCDDSSACAQAAVTVDVIAGGPATVHVADLDGTTEAFNRGRWRATTTVMVEDDRASIVPGATVTFDVDGRSRTCTTDETGRCSVQSRRLGPGTADSVSAVTGIVATGLEYDAAANADPDGDSDGTTIVIAKPGV